MLHQPERDSWLSFSKKLNSFSGEAACHVMVDLYRLPRSQFNQSVCCNLNTYNISGHLLTDPCKMQTYVCCGSRIKVRELVSKFCWVQISEHINMEYNIQETE